MEGGLADSASCWSHAWGWASRDSCGFYRCTASSRQPRRIGRRIGRCIGLANAARAVGTPGHLARGQHFLGQNYFPALVSKPVRENKNVTFCCDGCERGSWRRPWSVVTRVHLVAATEEGDDDAGDAEDEGEGEGEDDFPGPCLYPRRPRPLGRGEGDMVDDAEWGQDKDEVALVGVDVIVVAAAAVVFLFFLCSSPSTSPSSSSSSSA